MPRRRQPRPTVDATSDMDLGDGDSDGGGKHPQRNAANARERARMRVLSRAFCRLKTTLPWVPADTKLSKLDTLRLATSYIAHLRAVLTDQPLNVEIGQKHPLSLICKLMSTHNYEQVFEPRPPSPSQSRLQPKDMVHLTWPFSFQQTGTTVNTSCDSGGCWTNSSRDSEDEDFHNHQIPNIQNTQEIVRDYAPYYQQYTDTLMHIG